MSRPSFEEMKAEYAHEWEQVYGEGRWKIDRIRRHGLVHLFHVCVAQQKEEPIDYEVSDGSGTADGMCVECKEEIPKKILDLFRMIDWGN